MNHRRPWWLVFSLLPPLIALCGLLIPFGCGGSGTAPVPVGTPAQVAVAFVSVPPAGNFRSVLLNISGVRINKLAHAQADSAGWTTIAVPSTAGIANPQNPGDVQIDLMNTQTGPVIFNTAGAEQGLYNTVQILIDQNNPGTVVPACQSMPSNTEGCINYPLTFNTPTNPNGNIQPILLDLATPLTAYANSTVPLLIQLSLAIVPPLPINVGDAYEAQITANQITAAASFAAVSGAVTVSGLATSFHISQLTVSAELTGTNTTVESVLPRAKGAYTLELPAAPNGTTYDIFVGGGAVEYKSVQGLTLFPGQSVTDENFKVVQSDPAKVAGVIADACTGLGISGAQLELLAPKLATPTATGKPSPTPKSTSTPPSLCLENPNQCVVVAATSTDAIGNYPVGGTTINPNGFEEVPVNTENLALRISASGYATTLSSIFIHPLSKAQQCSASTSTTQCSFSLTTGYLSGTVQLLSDPPPRGITMVQVFAENSGTNQLVSSLPQPLVFTHGIPAAQFTMNVPVVAPTASMIPTPVPYDLFAVAIDPFQGAPNPYPGHDIPVLANQLGPAATCTTSALPEFAPMNCVGHGSISGTVVNPDLGTSVEVEKLDPSMTPVQILGTSPGLLSSSSPSNTQYTLCVPPDNYQLQRLEAPSPVPGVPTAAPSPVGAPQSVMVPQPASTSSPCPSSCSSTNTGTAPCPGLCQNTAANPL